MEIIKIEGTEYSVRNDVEELSVRDWFTLKEVYSERYYIVNGTLADGTELKEVAEPTEEFLLDKWRKVLRVISDIPDNFLAIDQVVEVIVPFIPDIFSITKKKLVTFDGVRFTIKPFDTWCFQQFCDFDSSLIDPLEAFLTVVRRVDDLDRPYDRYGNDREELLFLPKAPATVFIPLFLYLIEKYIEFKGYFKYLFEFEGAGESRGPNSKQHSKNFKWEDTIATLAETPVFNSPKGTLYAVRTARATEVLEYLNLKQSKDTAEYLDYKLKQRKK